MKKKLGFSDFLIFSILVAFCVICLYPFVHIVSVAFSTPSVAREAGLHLIPREADITSMKQVLESDQLWNAMRVTVVKTVVGTILTLLCTTMGAYAISKPCLPFRGFIMPMILIAMYFSGGMIPTYMVYKSLGLLNSIWVMILPMLVYGFNIIVMKNFFEELPDSVEESAKIDGANDFIILFRIVVPMSVPVIVTVLMWTVVNHWNAYMDNLLYITKDELFTLQRTIRNILSISGSEIAAANYTEAFKSGLIVVAILPVVIAFPFALRYFEKGIMLGAVKG